MRTISMPKVTIIAAVLAACGSASALTLPTSALNANSYQTFSQDSLDSFDLLSVSVSALGNTTPGANAGSFVLPITSVTLNGFNVASGKATGSALKMSRTKRDGSVTSVVLANFMIDYNTQQVLADATNMTTKVTTPQMAVFDFTRITPLSLKYKFPLSISLTETLGQLTLTSQAVDTLSAGLSIAGAYKSTMAGLDYGQLYQDIRVQFRSKPVSTKPYVAQ